MNIGGVVFVVLLSFYPRRFLFDLLYTLSGCGWPISPHLLLVRAVCICKDESAVLLPWSMSVLLASFTLYKHTTNLLWSQFSA